MPLGVPIPENQPALGDDPVDALRLKLQSFKERLLFLKTQPAAPLLNLPWNKEDLNELSVLVHSVYMASHKNEGTTGGKELLWADRKYKSLRLFKTIGDMIRVVPLRPVAVIQKKLIQINPSYNPAHLRLRLNKEAIAQHKVLEQSDQRYRSLVRLSAALGKPKNSITLVQVNEFKDVLRELCSDVLCQLEKGFELHRGERIDRLISQILFLDLQRQELTWRLAYWDRVEAMAEWSVSLQNSEITKLLSDVAVYVHETPEEYLARRNRSATKERVARHRRKLSKASDASA
jgi:hypothetical protein